MWKFCDKLLLFVIRTSGRNRSGLSLHLNAKHGQELGSVLADLHDVASNACNALRHVLALLQDVDEVVPVVAGGIVGPEEGHRIAPHGLGQGQRAIVGHDAKGLGLEELDRQASPVSQVDGVELHVLVEAAHGTAVVVATLELVAKDVGRRDDELLGPGVVGSDQGDHCVALWVLGRLADDLVAVNCEDWPQLMNSVDC